MNLPKVLIVHRDAGVASTSKELLEKYGYQKDTVFTTDDPVEALKILKQENVALVLCGSAFPMYRKTEVISAIDSHAKRDQFVLIAFTGGGERLKSIEAGADYFLAQPVGIKDLKSAVIKACNSQRDYHTKLAQRFTAVSVPVKDIKS